MKRDRNNVFRSSLSAIVLALGIALSAHGAEPMDAHLYDGFGNYKRPIKTESAECQQWFNQGMQLLYGFNHDEAIRSFHAAAEADAMSPMPWWGIAYAHGININDPAMTEERSTKARAAADKAMERIENGTAAEQALVRAVNARYALPIPEDRRPLDEAYAKAMGEAYASFNRDPDVGTLYAESLMNLQPWDYWETDGSPKGRIEEIVNVLEDTIAANPNHPGANHFYIHAVEASHDPDRAEAAAERLLSLVPGSGHLVHMPSHIFVRVGRYSDAVKSNELAVAADRAYFQKAPEPQMYAVYYAHNMHFLAFGAMMSGRYEDAIKAARELESEVPEPALRQFAGLIEGIMPTTLHVMIRFGKWEEILEEPQYPEWRLVSRAVRHYARSIANSALGNTKDARTELEAFTKAMNDVPPEWYVFNNKVSDVLPIANAMIEGELLWREGKRDEAYAALRRGIEAEGKLVYDEPPAWMLPVRHALGALLVSDKRYAEAEKVYREDLEINRDNGWALTGLHQALLAQGKITEAKKLERKIDVAWADADVRPQSSCYCEPGPALALSK